MCVGDHHAADPSARWFLVTVLHCLERRAETLPQSGGGGLDVHVCDEASAIGFGCNRIE
jgi:hypothetical protein